MPSPVDVTSMLRPERAALLDAAARPLGRRLGTADRMPGVERQGDRAAHSRRRLVAVDAPARRIDRQPHLVRDRSPGLELPCTARRLQRAWVIGVALLQHRVGHRDASPRRRLERVVLLRRRSGDDIARAGRVLRRVGAVTVLAGDRARVRRALHSSVADSPRRRCARARWRVGDLCRARRRAALSALAARLRTGSRVDHCDRLRLRGRLDLPPRAESLVGASTASRPRRTRTSTISPERTVDVLSRGVRAGEHAALITIAGDEALARGALDIVAPLVARPD